MHDVRSILLALVFLVVPTVVFAQYDPYFGTYDTPYVDYSSPTWTRTPESVTRPSGSSGSTGGATGGTTTGTRPSSGTTDAASMSIPVGATEVWVQPGPEPRKVFYAPEGTVEEPRAAADTTLRKIYVRSPLGKPNYTQSVGAFDTYDKGYIYTDKLTERIPTPSPSLAPTSSASARAVAPIPSPAKPFPPAPTTPPAVPAMQPREAPPIPSPAPAQDASGSDRAPAKPATKCGPEEKCASDSPTPARASPVRRIAYSINAFFGNIVRWFQHLGR